MARIRAMGPHDWERAAHLAVEAHAQGLLALPWETPADLSRLTDLPGATFLVAEDEEGVLAGVGGFCLTRAGEARLWGPLVVTEGHGTGAWLMNRLEAMAAGTGATAFSMTLALENRAGAAWAEWRGYVRDDEASSYLLCSAYPEELTGRRKAADVAYRRAEQRDLAQILALYAETSPAAPPTSTELAAVLPEMWVADAAGSVVAGFLWLRTATRRVKWMAVAPALRRRKIGTGLLMAAATANGPGRIETKVRQENEPMISLLRAAGFRRFMPVGKWVKRPG
jgi:ribosomal protein S18 acetylase RimI-like enzyme